jgi:hypothetical protein
VNGAAFQHYQAQRTDAPAYVGFASNADSSYIIGKVLTHLEGE